MKRRANTIDEYLAACSVQNRAALEKIRKAVRAAAPHAEECINHRLPAFRLDGTALVAFGACSSHCAFYPTSAATLAALKEDFKDYDTTKGMIRFPANKPIPAALVKKLVKAKMAESAARAANLKKTR